MNPHRGPPAFLPFDLRPPLFRLGLIAGGVGSGVSRLPGVGDTTSASLGPACFECIREGGGETSSATFVGCCVGLGGPERLRLDLAVTSGGVAVVSADAIGGGGGGGVWEAACDTVVYPGRSAEAPLSWA